MSDHLVDVAPFVAHDSCVAPGLLPLLGRPLEPKHVMNRYDATPITQIRESLPFRQGCSWMFTEVHRCTRSRQNP